MCCCWSIHRFNFTLRHLDVTCEAYDHFRASLDSLEKLADGRLRFLVEPVEASFPQLLGYERIQQLVDAPHEGGGKQSSGAGPTVPSTEGSCRPNPVISEGEQGWGELQA